MKSDGTVVHTGANQYGAGDVSGWTDIVSVSAGVNHSVGLKSDGTVVSTWFSAKDLEDTDDLEYLNYSVDDWNDIVLVSAGYDYTLGMKSDGEVVLAGVNDNGEYGIPTVTAIDAGYYHSFYQTVRYHDFTGSGDNSYYQCHEKSRSSKSSSSSGNSRDPYSNGISDTELEMWANGYPEYDDDNWN